MTRLTVRIALIALGAITLFLISVGLFGSWWRLPHMPTAEEWSALFGASALGALFFAWHQIRQVDQSNRELIRTNELARRANVEAIRPRVQVSLDVARTVWKRRSGTVEGNMYITVRNSGPTPAQEVRLTVDNPFDSLDAFFHGGKRAEVMNELNQVFDGTVRFSTLRPGAKYIWFLGRAPEIFDESNTVRRWRVEARFRSTAVTEEHVDVSELDLDLEKRLEIEENPLKRIGRDLEVVGDHLKVLSRRRSPSTLSLSEDAMTALSERHVDRGFPRPSLRRSASLFRTRR
ncbi:hypothetical protein QYR02_16865 [Microbacterium maritypicum]|uniref:hypothetical protein n=1 Tax=Microbacterium maritypicum TaxID=33918 RepID=UPI002673E27A|nr:hypothetical protein [Microbacterium liquefaciens]WKT89086.1 hypothetical protein QYR02_16865 [Microbacterium liquefaciens]